jgi:flagellar motor component MotA
MQLLGVAILFGIIWYGFKDRSGEAISAFDPHALTMVVGGSTAAVIISSSSRNAVLTFIGLGEFIPGLRRFHRHTERLEADREKVVQLWREGKRAAASEVAQASPSPAIARMLELILSRSRPAVSGARFTELRHHEIAYWQPIVNNWEMLSKLGPAFGMVGTITGMVQLFKNMSSTNFNIGAAMSLALLATLYGVAFGAGLAGPVANFLNNLLDERLGALERCEQSVNELVASGDI